MNCEEIKQNLGAVLDQAVDPKLEDAIMLHVSACSSCQDEWDRMQALRTVLRVGPTPTPHASLDARVMGAFYQSRIERREARSRWHRLVFGSINVPKPAFALILLAVASALFLAFQIGRMMATPIIMTMSPPDAIKVVPAAPHGQTVDVSVENGSKPRDASPRAIRRPAVARVTRARNPSRQTQARPLENLTVISAAGTNYSTKATLKDFEPITNATVRVIKGGGE